MHRKARLLTKLPDLKKALEMVELLIEKEGQEVASHPCLSRASFCPAIGQADRENCAVLGLTATQIGEFN